MALRIRIVDRLAVGLLVVLVAFIAGCGGGDGEEGDGDSGNGVTQGLTDQYDAAVNELNAAIRTFRERAPQDLRSENLTAVQADSSALRDACSRGLSGRGWPSGCPPWRSDS